MGRGTTRGRGRGRGRPRKVNTSTPTVAPTTEENQQPETAPTLQNTGTPTAPGTDKLTRRSPRLKELAEGKSVQEEAGEGNLTIGVSARGSSELRKKGKAAEIVVSSDLADTKGKASKRKKVASSSTVTEGNMKEEALKIAQAEVKQNLGTSTGNVDPSADYKSLYEAEKKRADELKDENHKLKDQFNVTMGRLSKYENVEPAKDTTPDATATAEGAPDTTEEGTPDATDTTPDADDGQKDSA